MQVIIINCQNLIKKMRRSQPEQQYTLQTHNELLINYKQDIQTQRNTFSPLWQSTWLRFQHDICSYILPYIAGEQILSSEMIGESNIGLAGQQASKIGIKHTFSLPYSIRELKRVIILHCNCSLDVVGEVRKHTTSIFYRIANAFVAHCFKNASGQLWRSVIQGYNRIKDRINVMVSCLVMVLKQEVTKRAIEDQIFSIINKEMINHHNYEAYVNSCLTAVEELRNTCLSLRQSKLADDFPSVSHSVIKMLSQLSTIRIFPYADYLQRSKKYYADLLSSRQLAKNIWMFPILYLLVKLERVLESVLVPHEGQIKDIEKLLKQQPWRALQQDSILRVLAKQVIEEVYEDLIQYVDYLLNPDNESQLTKKSEVQWVLTVEEKKDMLRYMWQLTILLQRNSSHEATRQGAIDRKSVDKKTQKSKLLQRMVMIAGDIKKFINFGDNNPNLCQLYKIIQFRDHILSIIDQCFDGDNKMLSAITMKIQETITDEEQAYNQKLCSIVLSAGYKFPRAEIQQNTPALMIDESLQGNTCLQLNNLCSFKLFKLTPSKQQFIRKFEQQFSSFVLPNWHQEFSLAEQEHFIRPIQKQIGYGLSRNIQRMLNDVWNQKYQCLVLQKINIFNCRVLSQDWPRFQDAGYRLADGLLQIRSDFQIQFLSQPQHDKKKLKWIEEFGRIKISISKIQSNVNELQASILILLSKSYRPLKTQQFVQVLEYTAKDMKIILTELTNQNLLVYNKDADNYELNYENQIPYNFEPKQKLTAKAQKKHVEKDYVFIIEAHITRILKRRKSVQKTDLSKLLTNQIKFDGHVATMEQINTAIERLIAKQFISVEKNRGIIKYIQ